MLDSLLHFLSYLPPFILVISVIVFVHEFGHYICARLCGVKVETFSLGFGRELFGRTDRHGTRWKVSLLPLGGYVKMFGDASEASTPDSDFLERMTPEERTQAFHFKPLPQKALVVFGGPLFNFLFAITVLTYFFVAIGRPSAPAEATQILPGSAAERAGVLPGDRFLDLDGRSIEAFDDIQRIVQPSADRPLAARIQRGDAVVELTITPTASETTDVFGDKTRVGLIGVKTDKLVYAKLALLPAAAAATRETGKICVDTLQTIGRIITGRADTKQLGGPIRIAEYSGKSVKQGPKTVLWLMAMLSISLGLFNLFPIPLLDGGHLLFYALEGIRRRPLGKRAQEYSILAGLAVLATLMIFTTFNDLIRLDLFGFLRQ